MRNTVSKAAIDFMKQPKIANWINSLNTQQTRQWYAYGLMRLLGGIGLSPDGFLEAIEKNPKEASINAKGFLSTYPSKARARSMLSAVKSFAEYHETELPNGLEKLKIRVVRTRGKPYLTWANAQRIIAKTKEPYTAAFTFLSWSGLGLDEFMEIQNDPKIHESVEKQRNDSSKSYIRIDLRPRKSNTDVFYILVPKEYVPKFPLRAHTYRGRSELVEPPDLEGNWERACDRAGLRQIGLGPHTLRSSFSSQCAKAGVADAVAEFQMSHGSSDRYGYRRETQDESYVAGELSKLWKGVVLTSETIEKLERRFAMAMSHLDARSRALALALADSIAPDDEKKRQMILENMELNLNQVKAKMDSA